MKFKHLAHGKLPTLHLVHTKLKAKATLCMHFICKGFQCHYGEVVCKMIHLVTKEKKLDLDENY
jgi:hypothetical protein